MITYKKGNIILANEHVIAHGCNAQGVMGSGVARAIRSEFEKAYIDYRFYFENFGLELGKVYLSGCKNRYGIKKLIANCITQQSYGKDGRVYASLDAIASCMSELVQIVDDAVAIPKIGCGLGGLRWEQVEPIMAKQPYDIVVYEL